MQTFDFFDYLNFVEQKAVETDTQETNRVLTEIQLLKEHRASLRIMQKHLKQYSTLKSLSFIFKV